MAKLNDDMEAVYKYWLDVTSGDVREKVVRKGVNGVNDIFMELQQDYGQAETRVLADLINIFNTGKPQGVSVLNEQIDMRSKASGSPQIRPVVTLGSWRVLWATSLR